MGKTKNIESSSLFGQAVLYALMEQVKIDPIPLRNFLLDLLEKTPTSDTEKIGWLFTDKTSFVVFYNLLKSHELISCDPELFRNHFINGTNLPKNKIIWRANLNELVYLFSRMREEKIIPIVKTHHLQLQKHFIDKYEKPLIPASLRVLLEKSVRNDKRIEIIDSIIEDILWQNKNSQS